MGTTIGQGSNAGPPGASPGSNAAHPSPTNAKNQTPITPLGELPPVTTVRGPSFGEATAAASGDAILSEFPIDDLGKITTDGTWPAGFRLDGGSVRLMWVGAHRFETKDGEPGYEVNFFAQSDAIDRLEQRMKDAGASATSYQYTHADLKEDSEPGRAVVKHSTKTWKPGTASSLCLDVDGSHQVELSLNAAESLKGKMRIRVLGDDQTATKTFQQVVNKLGLQDLFAPPTPESLERYKMMRVLWSTDASLIKKLSQKTFSDVAPDALQEAMSDAGLYDSDNAALEMAESADLGDPLVQERLQLAKLLLETSGESFSVWAKQQAKPNAGVLPSNETETNAIIRDALATLGISNGTPQLEAALETPISPSDAALVLRLATFIHQKSAESTAFMKRSVDDASLDDIRALGAANGIDLSPERMSELRFEEVYPGYFTVVDPSRLEKLEEAGARYLYSTSDSPERVWSMLSGGQKSSMTRMQEGLLLEGKSSSADFNSGGAFSIFSRLVTRSVIHKGKTGSGTSFGNWGGSRPYKLIINRRALNRLDWYGYNGDNYGNTTKLTKANHGEAIVKTIDQSYSASNEVMFNVGNDVSYIDFVVCENASQRDKLLDKLKSENVQEINGKKIEDFVLVHTTMFEHPDDQTFEHAVEDSVLEISLNEVKQQMTEAATAVIEEPAKAVAAETAAALVPNTVSQTATELAEAKAKSSLQSKLEPYAGADIAEYGKAAIEDGLSGAFGTQVMDLARDLSADAGNVSDAKIRTTIRVETRNDAKAAAEAKADELFDAVFEQGKASAPDGLTTHELGNHVRKFVREKLEEDISNVATHSVLNGATDAGLSLARLALAAKVRTFVGPKTRALSVELAESAAVSCAEEGVLEAKFDEAKASAKAAATESAIEHVEKTLANTLKKAIRDDVRTAAENKALELALASAVPAAIESVRTQNLDKTLEAAKKYCEDRGESFDSDKKQSAIEIFDTAISNLVTSTAETHLSSTAKQVPNKFLDAVLDDAVKDVVKEAGGPAVTTAIEATVDSLARIAVEKPIRKFAKEVASQVAKDAIEQSATEYADINAQQLFDDTLEATAKQISKDCVSQILSHAAQKAYDRVKTEAEGSNDT